MPSSDVGQLASIGSTLEKAIKFFETSTEYRDSAGVLSHAVELRRKVIEKIQSQFEKELSKYQYDFNRNIVLCGHEIYYFLYFSRSPLHDAIITSIVEEIDQVDPGTLICTCEELVSTIAPLIPENSTSHLRSTAKHLADLGQSSTCTASFMYVFLSFYSKKIQIIKTIFL